MKCGKCGNEFEFTDNGLLCIDAELCPCCGTLVSSSGEPITEPHFVLRYITDSLGRDIFLTPKRLLSIFTDILPKEKNAAKTLYVALYDGAGKNLLSVYNSDYEERSLMAARCVKSLRDGIGMKSAVSAQVIEWISYALGYHIVFKRNENITEKVAVQESRKNITDSEEQFWMGLYFDRRKEFHRALFWFERSALGGFASAQMMLGRYHSEGIGGAEQDADKAFRWYERAAKAGIGDAQCMLGHFYAEGIGCEKSDEAAYYWYRRAARMGSGEAEYILSLCCESGFMTAQSDEKAEQWLQKSEENGYTATVVQEPDSTNKGTGKGIGAVIERTISNIANTANSGVKTSEKSAPQEKSSDELYRQARTLAAKGEYDEALKAYEAAADMGNVRALCSLGKLYYTGNSVGKNAEKAYMCFRKAAESGYDIAQYNLGIMFLKGIFVAENRTAASEWFSLAAAQGHKEAIKAIEKMNK